jgi:hypothetical protein
MTPAERIATLLDEIRPNWYNEVNLDTLNMDDGRACLMGQLYGGYTKGRTELGISAVDAPDYGIVVQDSTIYDATVGGDVLDGLFEREYAALQDSIVAEINGRREFDKQVESMNAEARELELVAEYA